MHVKTSIAVLAASAFAILGGVVSVLAQDVGTATAVNPLSQGAPPGQNVVTLSVGSRIVHKERIQTTAAGTVQLLFLDKSTMSIAPNSNILIDDYAYNPASNSGHMVTSLAAGALRYVGGLLSHQGQATITTPVGAIGIRGGTVTIVNGANGTRVINHYGVITIQNAGGTVVISRPGFAVTILSWDARPSEPERVTASETAQYLRILTSTPGQNGGVPGLDNARISEFGIGGLQGRIGPDVLPVPIGNGESKAFQIIIQGTQHGTGRVQHPVTTPTVTTTPAPTSTPTQTPPPTSPPASPGGPRR